VQAGQVPAHLQREDRQRDRGADPKAPAHVRELGIGSGIGGDGFGLQRHAAERTRARPHLPHLGMHRAGVDRAGRRFGRVGFRRDVAVMGMDDGGRRRRAQIAGGIGLEFRAAAIGAEIVRAPRMFRLVFGRRDLDLHAADGIGREPRRLRARCRFREYRGRIGFELRAAAGAAEVERRARVLGAVSGGGDIHRHPAIRIDRLARRRRRRAGT